LRTTAVAVIVLLLFGNGRLSAAEPEQDEKPISQTLRITVTGRALHENKQPIAGATIYIVSTNSGDDRLLEQATTGGEGKYEFKDIALPVRSASSHGEIESGCFQVFGRAPERAFAWRGMKFVFPKDSPGRVRENAFLWGDPIELDLTFRARKSVSGRFLDEHGAPVAGVKIYLSGCDYIDPTGHESHRNFREFWAIQQAREVMADLLSAESDTEGRFAFDALFRPKQFAGY
jgi:hypothetical protein